MKQDQKKLTGCFPLGPAQCALHTQTTLLDHDQNQNQTLTLHCQMTYQWQSDSSPAAVLFGVAVLPCTVCSRLAGKRLKQEKHFKKERINQTRPDRTKSDRTGLDQAAEADLVNLVSFYLSAKVSD